MYTALAIHACFFYSNPTQGGKPCKNFSFATLLVIIFLAGGAVFQYQMLKMNRRWYRDEIIAEIVCFAGPFVSSLVIQGVMHKLVVNPGERYQDCDKNDHFMGAMTI